MPNHYPPRTTPRTPAWFGLLVDAVLTAAQIAGFFAMLWGVWFIAWVLG